MLKIKTKKFLKYFSFPQIVVYYILNVRFLAHCRILIFISLLINSCDGWRQKRERQIKMVSGERF